jgi:hypothetical protein
MSRWATAMKYPASLLLILVLAPCGARAADLTPFVQEHRVGVIIEKLRTPPGLRKDLVSGLTNRILIRLDFVQEGLPPSRKVAEVTIRYDLWEETFKMDTRIDNELVSTTTCRRVDEVISLLNRMRLPAAFLPDPGGPGSRLLLTAEILFNPMDKERMEEIRKWVAENSEPALPDPTNVRPGLSSPPPTSASRALFNKIFEQYAAGASLAAAWRDRGSARFNLNELPQ